MMQQQLYIKEVKGKGRGVFCSKGISKGETIELCPVIIVPATDITAIKDTKLADYSFYFNREENTLSIVAGFGSIYNYARYPNAVYLLDRSSKTMIFTACHDIPPHSEITINYSGEYGYDYSKWFTDRDLLLL